MRKLFLWIFLAALCAGLTGCAGTPPEETPENNALSSDIPKVSGESSADLSAEDNAVTPQHSASGGVLAADVRSRMKDETAENSPVFGSQALRRNEIRSVTFLSDVSRAPEKSWDVSQAGDGSVMAWVEESDGGGLYDLYIAGNGGVVAPEDCGGLFFGYSRMERISFNSAFDMAKAVNMREMFSDCRSLKSLDVGAFHTGKVTDMDSMFRLCASLTELDAGAFDTSNVTGMTSMFDQCAALSRLNLSGFDTSRVTDMSFMFYRCSSLTDLEISGFDTSNVTNMRSMFCGCSSLTGLEISGFDTSRVTDMSGMFADCSALTALNISNFDLSAVEDMAYMFADCAALKTLDMNGFAISEVADTTGVFNGCPVALEKG